MGRTVQIQTNPNNRNKNISCEKCRHTNIGLAKFCGRCGAKLIVKKVAFCYEFAYRAILGSAFLLLVFSGFLSYVFFNDTSSVRVSNLPFADVAFDHPVYSSCKNLLKIKGIGYRKFLKLAPYEKISLAEWNYTVKRAMEFLQEGSLEALYIDKEEDINRNEIVRRFKKLSLPADFTEDNLSRITAFVCLEKALFEGGA